MRACTCVCVFTPQVLGYGAMHVPGGYRPVSCCRQAHTQFGSTHSIPGHMVTLYMHEYSVLQPDIRKSPEGRRHVFTIGGASHLVVLPFRSKIKKIHKHFSDIKFVCYIQNDPK